MTANHLILALLKATPAKGGVIDSERAVELLAAWVLCGSFWQNIQTLADDSVTFALGTTVVWC